MRVILLGCVALLCITGCSQQKKKNISSKPTQYADQSCQVLASYMMFPELPLDAHNVQIHEVEAGVELAVCYDSGMELLEIAEMYVQDMERLGWDVLMRHENGTQSILSYQSPLWNCVIILESVQQKKIKTRVQVIQKKKSSR